MVQYSDLATSDVASVSSSKPNRTNIDRIIASRGGTPGLIGRFPVELIVVDTTIIVVPLRGSC